MTAPQTAPNLAGLLPGSIAADAQLQAGAVAVQPALDGVQQSVIQAEILSRIDDLPEPVLRMLALENRMDGAEWVLAKTITEKRALIKNSFELNRRRGTRWALERVFGLLNLIPTIQEWWEYGGEPGTWRVALVQQDGAGFSGTEMGYIGSLVSRYRPVSRHLGDIDMATEPAAGITYAALAITISASVTCNPAPQPGFAEAAGDLRGAISTSLSAVVESAL